MSFFFIQKNIHGEFLPKKYQNSRVLTYGELRYRTLTTRSIRDSLRDTRTRTNITRGPAHDPAAARVRPYKTCPRNYVVDTWRGKIKRRTRVSREKNTATGESAKTEVQYDFRVMGQRILRERSERNGENTNN